MAGSKRAPVVRKCKFCEEEFEVSWNHVHDQEYCLEPECQKESRRAATAKHRVKQRGETEPETVETVDREMVEKLKGLVIELWELLVEMAQTTGVEMFLEICRRGRQAVARDSRLASSLAMLTGDLSWLLGGREALLEPGG